MDLRGIVVCLQLLKLDDWISLLGCLDGDLCLDSVLTVSSSPPRG